MAESLLMHDEPENAELCVRRGAVPTGEARCGVGGPAGATSRSSEEQQRLAHRGENLSPLRSCVLPCRPLANEALGQPLQ